MKGKIIKLITVMLLLVTLTTINFIYVGASFISLAAEEISTNHKNIEFTSTLKSEKLLTLTVAVKNEGYFNGEITLENSNFKLKNISSQYVNKVEGNKIVLNQINAGTTASFDVEIEPVKEESLDAGLLSAVSELNLLGIYKDSTEKDIEIEAKREVKLEYSENNNEENIENTAEIITNKVVTVNGEEKRIVQLSINMGLKENNYPIREITGKVTLPEELDEPEVVVKSNLNTMTDFVYNSDNGEIKLQFTNEPNNENKILWKKSGNENVVLTLIYNKDVNLENTKLPIEQTVKLYNSKEIKVNNTVEIGIEEKDALMQVNNTPLEETIYKGKINASIDRTFETKTKLVVNLSNVGKDILVKEDASYYNLQEGTIGANVVYNKTVISKASFDKILGENGSLTILNEEGQILGTVISSSEADENGNIVIDYTGKEPSSIQIKTSVPVKEGDLELIHTKTIKAGEEGIIGSATELVSNTSIEYGTGITNKAEGKIKLENAKTESSLSIDKDTLSTVVTNDVEIRATLKANNEQYNLYENPRITFELPEAVENITINNVELVYEDELAIQNYYVDGRNIILELAGKQTKYKQTGIEGTIIVIDANVNVNRKSATQDGRVLMTVENKGEIITSENPIKVVAPTDMTVIHSISDLGVETIGENEEETVSIDRGAEERNLQTQIEVINNNENAMENVKVLGTFPTRSEENNIDTNIIEGLNVEGIEGAKVYYTENENATNDLQNSENGWEENIQDGTKVRKYLVEVPLIESGTSVMATYITNVPASLEYNQKASQDYVVDYQNTLTKATNEVKATEINMETGVGPDLETKVTASVSGSDQQNGSKVKNGEVIRYKVEVSNVGSEDIDNVTINSQVPEGTTLVVPKNNYEYTGSSYYEELENRTYENTINNLKVGEVVTKEYEVRVNNDTEPGTNLVNKSSIKYGDVTKESGETSLITENGDVRVTVKRITDTSTDLYENGVIQYFAIVENISDETQENVKVRTNLPESLEVSRLNLVTGMPSQDMSDEDLYQTTADSDQVSDETEIREVTEEELTENTENLPETEQIEYQDELDIGSIEPGQNKVLSYDLKINKVEEEKPIDFSVVAEANNQNYRSNIVSDNVRKIDISMSIKAEPEGNYIKAGDTLKYIINIKNNGTQDINDLKIKDTIPNSLTVTKVTLDGQEQTDLKEKNNLEIRTNVKSGEEVVVEIETLVNYSAARVEAEAVTNKATGEVLGETIATTTELTHIIEANEENSGATEDPDGENNNGNNNNGSGNNNDNSNVATGNAIITGLAWFDENANGARDPQERTMSGVKVQLLNAQTNTLVTKEDGSVLETTTNENGVYVLDHIQNGNYIVIFDNENSAYGLTKYKAEGISETNNSDAIVKEMTIDGTSKEIASTDIIEIDNMNVSDINAGYIELQNFDLQLEKYVTRIVVQDSSGSTVREYNDEDLARAELDAKRVNGATVLIEYVIRVSNVGEVDGYARRIADYAPNDLEFSSELNKDWYQTQDGIYSESLANEIIKPGETKEIKLTLTKTMTEDNVGLVNNTAEIDEAYNELGLLDSNSTPGNRTSGENDMGSADVLLGIKTGGAVYVGGTIVAIVILGAVVFIVIRKKNKAKEEI